MFKTKYTSEQIYKEYEKRVLDAYGRAETTPNVLKQIQHNFKQIESSLLFWTCEYPNNFFDSSAFQYAIKDEIERIRHLIEGEDDE